MKKLFDLKLIWLPFAFLLSLPAVADTGSAFKAFQELKGKWSIKSGDKILPVEMTYDSGSKDSIVTEQFGKELAVIYKDGDKLQMAHFCNAGNQPRLQLKSEAKSGVMEFEMTDITGLKTKDAPHVYKVVYRLISKDQFEAEWVWKKGTKEETEKYVLTRISSGG